MVTVDGLVIEIESNSRDAEQGLAAFASFDELNVIQQQNAAISGGGGGGGGGAGVGDMFEEQELSPWAKWLQEHLGAIKVLAAGIGTAIAAWKIGSAFVNAIQKVRDIIDGIKKFFNKGTKLDNPLNEIQIPKNLTDLKDLIENINTGLKGIGDVDFGDLKTKLDGLGDISDKFSGLIDGLGNLNGIVSSLLGAVAGLLLSNLSKIKVKTDYSTVETAIEKVNELRALLDPAADETGRSPWATKIDVDYSVMDIVMGVSEITRQTLVMDSLIANTEIKKQWASYPLWVYNSVAAPVVAYVRDMVAQINSALNSIQRDITVNVRVKYSTSGSVGSFGGGTSRGGGAGQEFANGGFPEIGQLFIAREAGPELVGQIHQAQENKLIVIDPTKEAKLPKMEQKEIEFLSVEEIKKLLAVLPDTTNGRAIRFILGTGIRASELCGLRWCDVSDEGANISQIVYVVNNRALSEEEKKMERVKEAPKTSAGRRFIPFSDGTLPAILEEQKKQQRIERMKAGSCWIGGEPGRGEQYVFATKSGAPADRYNLGRTLRNCFDNAGLKRRGLHALRHTFATLWIQAGQDVRTLSEILGHTSVSFTMQRYVHSDTATKRRGMAVMASYLAE